MEDERRFLSRVVVVTGDEDDFFLQLRIGALDQSDNVARLNGAPLADRTVHLHSHAGDRC